MAADDRRTTAAGIRQRGPRQLAIAWRVGPRKVGSLLAWVSLVALALGLSLQQIVSVDYWWLLRTGRIIAETGSVPRAAVFTYTAPGAAWINIHWLFQLGLWGAFQLGGHAGALVGKLGLVLALLALLAPIGHRPGRSFLVVGSLGLLLLAHFMQDFTQ